MRQVMPSLLLVLTFLGCKPDPHAQVGVAAEDWASNVQSQRYMMDHFPGLQFRVTCAEDMRLYLHGENFHFCTVDAGNRVFTLGCKPGMPPSVGCVLLGSAQQ